MLQELIDNGSITETQIANIREAAVHFNISLNSYSWFVDGFQSAIKNDGTNETLTLRELLELQAVRKDEGQTSLNLTSIKKMLTNGKGNFPLLSKAPKVGFIHNYLYEPIVTGSTEDGEYRSIVSGGHRTGTILALLEILADGDDKLVEMYLDSDVNVIDRIYPDRESLAKAILLANGSRTATGAEKDVVLGIAQLGIDVNNVNELKEQIETGKLSPQDWIYKIATKTRRYVHPTTGEELKDNTLKSLFAKTYKRLIDAQFAVYQGDSQGEATEVELGTYRFIKDLLISNRHKYTLDDNTMPIWGDYDSVGDIWQFSETKKHWEWVIPSKMFEIIEIIADELQEVLNTTEETNIARGADSLAEFTANGVIDRILAEDSPHAVYALPPKPPVQKAAKTARTAKKAKTARTAKKA